MRRVRIRERLNYAFDSLMSRGMWVMLLGLVAATLAIVVVTALIVELTGSTPESVSFPRLVWMAFVRTLDPGTMGGDVGRPIFLGLMLLVTLAGVFMVGALISIINSGMENRLDRLRRGRSLVLVQDHTLILGWNEQVFTIIEQLVLANQSRKKRRAVVILANQDKVEMESAVHDRVRGAKNTRIVFRSGDPIDPRDVAIGNPQDSRSIIILPSGDDPDTNAIKSLLAVIRSADRRDASYRIVVQLSEASSLDIVRMVGVRDRVVPVLANDVIARVAAQTSRQAGLSVIYTDLLNFEGDEVYFYQDCVLSGSTFGQVLTAFDHCTVIGIRNARAEVRLNPSMETVLGDGDSVILIAEDDASVSVSASWAPGGPRVVPDNRLNLAARPENTLILGWNCQGATILQELENYVSEGSRVQIVADVDEDVAGISCFKDTLVNQNLEFTRGDIRDRRLLETLRAADYDHVIVLAYDDFRRGEADAITLLALLHLRHIAERDDTPFSIVSEMLDMKNRELAEDARPDDFIVSDHLISLMMAQLFENDELEGVFSDLFGADGAEIRLRSASDFAVVGVRTTGSSLTQAAQGSGEIFLGYRLASESWDPRREYGVHLNPPKWQEVAFAEEDQILVLTAS